MDRLESHRAFFAQLITATVGVPGGEGRLADAFAATPRERFVGPGPWRVFTAAGYIATPSDDPAFLYQDITVALEGEGQINNGQPTLHALCLNTLNVQAGETVVHVGAGTGYYTAVLARLAGPAGAVVAYEIEERLALRATANLADLPQATVQSRSGSAGPLPECDVVYVSAGATAPLDAWLDALRPGGRLLFPLTPAQGAGGLLLITRTITRTNTRSADDRLAARFLGRVLFIPCVGARDEETAGKLTEAFNRGDVQRVQSLRRGTPPDDTCWVAGNGWWLATV